MKSPNETLEVLTFYNRYKNSLMRSPQQKKEWLTCGLFKPFLRTWQKNMVGGEGAYSERFRERNLTPKINPPVPKVSNKFKTFFITLEN